MIKSTAKFTKYEIEKQQKMGAKGKANRSRLFRTDKKRLLKNKAEQSMGIMRKRKKKYLLETKVCRNLTFSWRSKEKTEKKRD